MRRGDVILVRFPHPSGLRGKKRPAVIVQSDAWEKGRVQITGNNPFIFLSRDPTIKLGR